eukprot:6108109-Pleurochrysis_carterae.AAC.1
MALFLGSIENLTFFLTVLGVDHRVETPRPFGASQLLERFVIPRCRTRVPMLIVPTLIVSTWRAPTLSVSSAPRRST